MTEPIKALVAYYRVSTAKQGASGLGLEGQVAAVEQYARDRGAAILRAYQEVERGKRADRPELANAVAHARRSGATLVIAKLDRLARNVHFLAGLMEAKVGLRGVRQPAREPSDDPHPGGGGGGRGEADQRADGGGPGGVQGPRRHPRGG